MKNCGIDNADDYKGVLTEILTEVLPQTGSKVNQWDVDIKPEGGDEGASF